MGFHQLILVYFTQCSSYLNLVGSMMKNYQNVASVIKLLLKSIIKNQSLRNISPSVVMNNSGTRKKTAIYAHFILTRTKIMH